MQTSANYRSRRRHVSHMTDDKGETWSPSGMSKVRSRARVSSGRLFHAHTPNTVETAFSRSNFYDRLTATYKLQHKQQKKYVLKSRIMCE